MPGAHRLLRDRQIRSIRRVLLHGAVLFPCASLQAAARRSPLTASGLIPDEVPVDPRRAWAKLDQAARNAAYDNNAAVAGSAALIEQRNAASAAFRAAHAGALDLPYAQGERTRFDLYPAAEKSAPCLVFIHGGYWQRNSREAFAMLAEGVLAQGWSAAMPGYTLAPAATLTQIADEITLAL